MKYAVIAAGEGSRLVEEGIIEPKPLVRINGETMIDRLLRIFLENNAESISIIVNNEMTVVQKYVQGLKLAVPVNIVVKSTPSSMHSFYELTPYLKGGKFVLTTVDTMFREEEFAEYVSEFDKSTDIDALMAVTDYIDDEKPLYVETDGNLDIIGFKDVVYSGARYISGGIYGLSDNALDILRDSMMEGVSRMRNYQRRLVENGLKLKAYPFSKIIDVDHASDIEKAAIFVKR
ncbi:MULTISPECIES: NTP transferase domain-containing protein [Bacteroidales]|jgi:hexapeptide repeat-containing ADP-glucose pyrophosphorylase|uniref:NTP transferase domain-containing protein n=1 Tax=Bacteroidales TaxID=171549 RepID=UPI0006D778DA|nr:MULTISPECIES: NTP transferase domain-containing protein [Bacteroidales]